MKPYVIAHRGVSQNIPENTLPAFSAAMNLGADGIETDVQLTADGKLVLHHNYTIDACSNGTGAIYAMTLEALSSFDFGSFAGEQWVGTPIATLQDLLHICKDLPIINIELKAPVDRTLPYIPALIRELETFGQTDNIIISAFDHSLLKQIKTLDPGLSVAPLTLPAGFAQTPLFALLEAYLPEDANLIRVTREDFSRLDTAEYAHIRVDIPGADLKDALAELAHQIGAAFPDSSLPQVKEALLQQQDLPAYLSGLGFPVEYVHCHFLAVLRDNTLVSRLKQAGILCNVWTPDDPKILAMLLDSGCNGVITNRPEILLSLEGRL